MSQDDLFGAPAGWYPDPLGLPQLRWWNNHAWTEQTSAARQPMVVQDTKFAWADDDLPTRREERERERSRDDRSPVDTPVPTAETLRELEPPRAFTQVNQGAAATPQPTFTTPQPTFTAPVTPAEPVAPAAKVESLYTPDPIVEAAMPLTSPTIDRIFDVAPTATAPAESLDALFGAKASRRTSTRVKTTIGTAAPAPATATASRHVGSGPVWVIAMIPLFQLVVSLLYMTALGMAGSQFVYIGILALPYFVVVLLAYFDHKAMKEAGYDTAPHWAWAFLTAPVYLLLRARASIRETGHGIGPLLVWFGLGFLHLASLVVIPGLLIALIPSVFLTQIEQSVEQTAYIITSTPYDVTCLQSPPVLQGETIVCDAADPTNRHLDITVTLQRKNGWIDWQVIDWGQFQKTPVDN